MLLLQLGSIENDQIWSFLRYWVSLRNGGEKTFRVSKTKKFWTFLVKDECSCNYKSVLDAVKRWNRPLEAFEGQAWPIYPHATEWKTRFGRCSNVQNFFYFWYDVEFWKGNLLIKKKLGVTGRIKEKKTCKYNFEYLALRRMWRTCHSYPIICIRGGAGCRLLQIMSVFFYQFCTSMGPTWMELKFLAEFENLVLGFERLGQEIRPSYGSRSRWIEIERPSNVECFSCWKIKNWWLR